MDDGMHIVLGAGLSDLFAFDFVAVLTEEFPLETDPFFCRLAAAIPGLDTGWLFSAMSSSFIVAKVVQLLCPTLD